MNKHIVSAVIIALGAIVVAGCNKACVDKDVLEPKVQRVLCVDASSQKLFLDVEADPKTIVRNVDTDSVLEYVDGGGQKWSWFLLGTIPCAVTDTIAVTQARQTALKARTPQPAPAPPAPPAPAPTDAGPVQSDAGPPSKR